MPISRKTVLQNLQTYSKAQLDHMTDTVCAAIIAGKISSAWHDVIHAIDAEIDRRLGYPELFSA